MTFDETSDPGGFPRGARLVAGLLGWAILAVGVIPFTLPVVAGLALYIFAPGLLGLAPQGDDGGELGDTGGIGWLIVLVGVIALALVALSRTGPAIGRLARPRRRPLAYVVDVAAASSTAFGAALLLLGLERSITGGGYEEVPVDVLAAITLIRELNFVIAPVAIAAGIVWLIERDLRRRLPRPALGVIAGLTLLFCVGFRTLYFLGDPTALPGVTAALAIVQVAAFVFARSAVAVVLPPLAVSSSLVLLPGPGPDVGLATGALVLGLGLAVVTRARPRMVDAEPAA